MSVEKEKEEVHIFSAGESIVKTFRVANKRFHIDRIIVFREQMEAPEKGEQLKKIESAIKELRDITKVDDIKYSEEKIRENDLEDLMEKMFRIKKEHEGDSFYFNLTGGRKVPALYLYTMAIWLDGLPYYVDMSGKVIQFEIPKIQREVLIKKPQYVNILRIVYDGTKDANKQIKYIEVFKKLESEFKTRRKTQNSEEAELRMGTFSKWIRELTDRELLDEMYKDHNHKVKYLGITNNGIYALKFYRDL